MILLPSGVRGGDLTLPEELLRAEHAFQFESNHRINNSLLTVTCCSDEVEVNMLYNRPQFEVHSSLSVLERTLARRTYRDFGDWHSLYRFGTGELRTLYFVHTKIRFWRTDESAFTLDLNGARLHEVIRFTIEFN